MLKCQVAYRRACEGDVLALFESSSQLFWTRDQVVKQSDISGRALDRVLRSLATRGVVARFHLVLENGEPSPLNVYGVLPHALSYRRLNFVQYNGEYILSESSSDDVTCYLGRIDLAMSEAEPRSLLAATFDQVSIALFPSLRGHIPQRYESRTAA